MRCPEVTRELAAPTGGLDPDELAGHLAGCPRCAAWAARAERLDRLWEATRPDEPTAADFDAIWAGVCGALDAPADRPAPRPASSPARRRRVVAIAQAAVVLVAALLLLRGHRPDPAPFDRLAGPGGQAPDRVARLDPIPDDAGEISAWRVDIAPGQLMIIPASFRDDVEPKVGQLPQGDAANTVDADLDVAPDFLVLNHLEAIAQSP